MAFAAALQHLSARQRGGSELHTLQVFTVTAGGISRNSVFQDSEVFASLGLAAGLDGQGRSVRLTNADFRDG